MPSRLDPDAALMLRVKQGDMAAFEQLVEKYKQPVFRLVYRSIQDASEAEDLTQKVFVQVYRSSDRYRVSARFSTWLFTIARNLCLNEIRRRSRHPSEPLEGHPTDDDETPARQISDPTARTPADGALVEELHAKVQEAIFALPESQRTALLLCREEDVSYEAISKILGCSMAATKSLIHRGRETLKQKLKPYLRSGQWSSEEP